MLLVYCVFLLIMTGNGQIWGESMVGAQMVANHQINKNFPCYCFGPVIVISAKYIELLKLVSVFFLKESMLLIISC